MTGWYGGEEGGHIGFSPVAPLTGRDALAVRDLLRGMIEDAGLDYMAGADPDQRAQLHPRDDGHLRHEGRGPGARRLRRRPSASCARPRKQGYGEYRAHLDFMDLAADQYSWGDHAYRRFTETIKDALDPERHPLARQAGDLAARHAQRRAAGLGGAVAAGSAFGPLVCGGRVLSAGHGLRLRKLRLTPCPAPPARGPSLPGRAPPSAPRSARVTRCGLTDEFSAPCWSVRRIPIHGRLTPCGN